MSRAPDLRLHQARDGTTDETAHARHGNGHLSLLPDRSRLTSLRGCEACQIATFAAAVRSSPVFGVPWGSISRR